MATERPAQPTVGEAIQLQQSNLSELRQLGRLRGVPGVSRMTKARLVKVLAESSAENGSPVSPASIEDAGTAAVPQRLASSSAEGGSDTGDHLLVEPANHRWLRVAWSLCERTLERAASAMGSDWHRAVPVLRLYHMLCDDTGPRSKERIVDLELPADAQEWFVNVPLLGECWQVEIGFLTRRTRFFSLLHSVPLELPRGRLAHPTEDATRQKDSDPWNRPPELTLTVSSDVVVRGRTLPEAHLTVDDVDVPVDAQTGEFVWQAPLNSGRHVIPIIAATKMQKQRAVLAIDCHLRQLESESRHGE